MRKMRFWSRGATQLRFMDVLTALILLAILVCVAWLQFPAYQGSRFTPGATASRTASP